jgi:hypothetical protein
MIVSARAGINGDWLKTKKRFLVLQGMRGRQLMAEPEVEAAWRAEFKRSGATQLRETPDNGGGSVDKLKEHAAFRGSVTKPKSSGSNRKKLTTMVGGPCSSPSLP